MILKGDMMSKKLSNSPIFHCNGNITECEYFTDEGGSKKMPRSKIYWIGRKQEFKTEYTEKYSCIVKSSKDV